MMLRRYHPDPDPDSEPTEDAEPTDNAPQPKAAGRSSSKAKPKEG
ncbi:hypothetical protein [Streptomyces globisporus]